MSNSELAPAQPDANTDSKSAMKQQADSIWIYSQYE